MIMADKDTLDKYSVPFRHFLPGGRAQKYLNPYWDAVCGGDIPTS